MRSILSYLFLAMALNHTALVSEVLASEDTTSEVALHGDAEAGKAISATCASCHGADGNSPAPTFPNIAGQVSGYIAQQLRAYKNPEDLSRNNPVMMGMTAALSEQNMLDLDAYYSSLPAKQGAISADQESDALAGEEIYRAGVAEFAITACMACHGPDGKGVAPNFPSLAGQHATYTEEQLIAFKTGTRQNSMMNPIAFALSEAQIKQLALYISALK